MDTNMTEDQLVVHLEGDQLLTTTKGEMLRSDLDRRVVTFEDDNELTYAIEYRLQQGPIDEKGERELVHRSVHVQLKKNVVAESLAAFIGG